MDPVTIALRTPVQFGRDAEPIAELTIKPNARAFRDFSLPMREDGTILFQPYELAKVGIKLAGHPTAVLDLMDPADMWEVAQAVMGFTVPGLKTGSTPSP